jgi:hypothetical protein
MSYKFFIKLKTIFIAREQSDRWIAGFDYFVYFFPRIRDHDDIGLHIQKPN